MKAIGTHLDQAIISDPISRNILDQVLCVTYRLGGFLGSHLSWLVEVAGSSTAVPERSSFLDALEPVVLTDTTM